jgi:PAS domain S-box-containing protein
LLTAGRHVPIDDSAAPIRNSDGHIVGGVLVFRDITERRKAERQLSDSEEFARSVIESSSDCIKVLDLDGRMLSMNSDGCKQMEIDDFLTCLFRFWPEFWAGEEQQKALNAFEVAKAGETATFEGFCPTAKGNPRWWEVIVSPIGDSTGVPIRLLTVSRDITERRRTQTALQLALKQLEASAEELRRSNEDLSQFAHVASHDLRSPLNTIDQFTQLLERSYSEQLGKDGSELLLFIKTAAQRMAALIDALLSYASASTAMDQESEPIDANTALSLAIENLRGASDQSRATITFDRLPHVRMKTIQLVQIFQNLIGNAIHYRDDDVPKIHISAVDRDGQWVFSCKDNGIGVAPQYQEKIFEPFERLHGHDRPGSGIGLAVCKKIIGRFRGRIWVESTTAEPGSTFFFTVPKGVGELMS